MQQLESPKDILPNSDWLVHIESIDSTVCVCQSESEEYHDAFLCALFLEVLKTQTHGCRVSVGIASSFAYPFAVL